MLDERLLRKSRIFSPNLYSTEERLNKAIEEND